MRVIALMPVKNERWIIERSLNTLVNFCDLIIIADQQSTDGTREFLEKFSPKVITIENQATFHSTKIRWRLLELSREYHGNNFLFLPDADEIFSANILKPNILDQIINSEPGTAVEVPWVQLWRSSLLWRNDGSIWSNRYVSMGFRDDRQVKYGPILAPNDHNPRIPVCHGIKRLDTVKLLHFQFVLFGRMLAKQRWYRVVEAIEHGKAQAERINHYYRVTRDERQLRLDPIETDWLSGWQEQGIDLKHFEEQPLYWYDVEALRYFADKGPAYFAALDIWDVDWEEKRRLAKSQGYGGIPEEPLVDPRTTEQRLYHAYLHRFFRTPPWRDPYELVRAPKRWLRAGTRALGLRRRHLERLGLNKFRETIG